MTDNRIILAYSGGLDTTYCLSYLQTQGYEVIAVSINTGGFNAGEEESLRARALKAGAKEFVMLNESERYYKKVLRYLVFGNVLKNGNYPLSVSAERIAQASALAAFAEQRGIKTIAHGSTGAGNDQIRFDMILQNLIPGVQLVTPIRDLKLSRMQELDYLKSMGIEFPAEKATYSINQGLWGTSVGGKETLNSWDSLPEEAWPTPVTKTEPEEITIDYKNGEPVGLNGKQYDSSVALINDLQALAGPFGIGRDIHVGDTILGIKGRVGFEAAAPTILIKSHQLLEKHVLTKSQILWKDQLAAFYGNNLHDGMYLDPLMRNIEKFMEDSQRYVNGKVRVKLHPYRFELLGIQSPHDLMSGKFGTYGEENKSWTAQDAKGFIRIYGNQNSIFYQVNQTDNPYNDHD